MEVKEIKSTKRIKHYSKFCEICAKPLNKKMICKGCNILYKIPMKEKTIIIRREEDLHKTKNCEKCGSLLLLVKEKGYCKCPKCRILYNFQSI